MPQGFKWVDAQHFAQAAWQRTGPMAWAAGFSGKAATAIGECGGMPRQKPCSLLLPPFRQSARWHRWSVAGPRRDQALPRPSNSAAPEFAKGAVSREKSNCVADMFQQFVKHPAHGHHRGPLSKRCLAQVAQATSCRPHLTGFPAPLPARHGRQGNGGRQPADARSDDHSCHGDCQGLQNVSAYIDT